MKFSLSYPINPFVVIQPFGVNGAYYQANGINIIGHNGLDLKASHGQPIYAAHDGEAWYEVDNDQGHGVVVVTKEQFDYKTTKAYFKSIYWHMCDSVKEPQFKSPVEAYRDTTKPGMPVKKGDLIGYADSTGFSTGDHLHFGLKPMILSYPSDYTNIEQSNGYLGAIDPTPYFEAPTTSVAPFLTDMALNDKNPEIKRLQAFLRSLGYFNYPEDTDLYGSYTRLAVFKFQLDYVTLSWWERYYLQGKVCGPKTRDALNKLINK